MAYGKVLCLSLKPLPPPEPPPQPGWHSYYNCKYELYLAAATATRISRVAATLVVLLVQQEKPIAWVNWHLSRCVLLLLSSVIGQYIEHKGQQCCQCDCRLPCTSLYISHNSHQIKEKKKEKNISNKRRYYTECLFFILDSCELLHGVSAYNPCIRITQGYRPIVWEQTDLYGAITKWLQEIKKCI